jgi:hypothetical protein
MSGPLDAFRTPDLGRLIAPGGTMPPATFSETWGAALQAGNVLDRSDSYDLYAQQLAQPVVDALRQRGRTAIQTGYGRRIAITPRNFARDRQVVADRIWQEVAAERERDPEFLKDLPDREAFEAAVLARRKHDLGDAEAVLARSSGIGGAVGGFLGAADSTLRDPVTWITTGLTLPFGGPVTGGIARRIGITALREATLNTAATVPALAFKAENAEELGREYDIGDAALDLGLSAVVGGAFGAGAAGLGLAADKGIERYTARQLARELEALPQSRGVELTPDEMAAVKVLRRQAEDLDASPYQPGSVADGVHLSRLHETEDALLHGEPLPQPEVSLAPEPAAIDAQLPGNYRILSAKVLQTDPETFQYKAGGDGQGVTDKLRGVTEWNADAAGAIMVWERADGTLFVADGHQRSGLARRLIGEGRYDDIGLLAHVYREADGVSARQAMMRAAGANILAGTGTPLDAARIIRLAGLDSEHLRGFNRASAFGQQAIGLSRLSDDAFGLVINGDDETMIIGAIVGKVAPETPELHAQMIQALRTADVSSEGQRELMLRDMLAAPRSREHQHDMFGVMEVTRSLYAERARILERTLKIVRDAKRALVSAADNADTLAEAGARIDRGRAAAVAAQNAQLADVIERLARVTDNPVNAALSRAAVAMSEGKRADAAARDFLGELRAQPDLVNELVTGRGAGGDDAGGAGRAGGTGAGAAAEGGARAGGAEGGDAGELKPTITRAEAEAGQLGKSLDELERMAAANQVALNDQVRAIARDLGVKGVEAKPKARARIIEKVEKEGYAEPGQLMDLARAAFTVRTAEEADAIIARLRRQNALFDKGWVENRASGYLDRKLVLRFENGGAAEVQIIPQGVYDFKSGRGTELYNIELANRGSPEAAAALAESKAGYAAARAGSPFEDFGSLSKSASGNSLRKSASDMEAPSHSTLDENASEGAFQRPSDQTNPTPSTSAQGRSSNSSSSTDIGDPFEPNIGLDGPEGKLASDALGNRVVDDFDDPLGAGAASQAEHLTHDMRADLDAGAEPEEPGGLFALFDGDEVDPRAELGAIDADVAAFDAVKGCLK